MRILLLMILLPAWMGLAQGQVRFGLKGGISTYNLGSDDLLVVDQDDVDSFSLGVKNANYGYHVGLLLQGMMGQHFFLQAEAVFNSNTVDYSWKNLDNSIPEAIFKEKYNYLDIPLLLGLKAGPLRFNAGPVAHVFLTSKSDLTSINGFEQRFRKAAFGWQGGIGIDFWRIQLDVRYEGNFNRAGDHFQFFGNRYQFSDNPSRILFSVGFLIFNGS